MIRVAIAGVGSCCSSFVQTVAASRSGGLQAPAGISHAQIGGRTIADMTFVAAFDVDRRKVGFDLAEAIFAPPNAAVRHQEAEPLGVEVDAGPVADGLTGRLSEIVEAHPAAEQARWDAVAGRLKSSRAQVLVCCLPTGADAAIGSYAAAAAEAGCAFVNCTPTPVARDREHAEAFRQKRLPLLGDDLRSHVGATALHGEILELLVRRGISIESTYQLNVGGNADFLNLSDPARSAGKVASKENGLRAAAPGDFSLWAGPSAFVPDMGDTKVCHLQIIGRSLLHSRLSIGLTLEVEDSPNAAAVMVNAVRVAALALDRGLGGPIEQASSFLFKSPIVSRSPSAAWRAFEDFVTDSRDDGN
jgi:myo-inositol-1-phosphate synthase